MIGVKEDLGGQVETLSVHAYDAFNKLKTYTEGSLVTTMVYDGDGRRVRKTLEDTASSTVESDISYLYDGRRILYEVDETGLEPSVIASYTYGINLIARQEGTSGSTSYYLYNGHGDVTGLVDIDGVLIGSFDYEAFGDILEETGIGETPFKYAGEYQDLSSGLIYLWARYYDPSTGRFISEDPHWDISNMIYGDDGNGGIPNIAAIMQGSNLYVYVRNNPVNRWDTTGRLEEQDKTILDKNDLAKMETLTAEYNLATDPLVRDATRRESVKIRQQAKYKGQYSNSNGDGVYIDNYNYSDPNNKVTVVVAVLSTGSAWAFGGDSTTIAQKVYESIPPTDTLDVTLWGLQLIIGLTEHSRALSVLREGDVVFQIRDSTGIGNRRQSFYQKGTTFIASQETKKGVTTYKINGKF